jgi:hypothetical protein
VCPELKRQKEIKKMMAAENVSYAFATKTIRSSKKTFSEVVASEPTILPIRKKVQTREKKVPQPTKPFIDHKALSSLLYFPNGQTSSQLGVGSALRVNESSPNSSEANIAPLNDPNSTIQTIINLLLSLSPKQNNLPSNAATDPLNLDIPSPSLLSPILSDI